MLQQAQTFMERHHPLLYLYGNATSGDNEEAAKVLLVYSREKPDHTREKVEGDWICKIVSPLLTASIMLLTSSSVV